MTRMDRWVIRAFVCVTLVGIASLGSAQSVLISIPASEDPAPDVRSAAFIQAEAEAVALWDAGGRAEAKLRMYRQSTDAAPADAAAAKVRLGKMNVEEKCFSEAKRLFESVADMASGVNDAAKSEAGMRLAYVLYKEDKELSRVRFERLLSGEYVVSNSQACEAATRLGAMAHRVRDLNKSTEYYDAIAQNGRDPHQVAHAKSELAGLWLELGKGEGGSPLPSAERAAAFDQARLICQAIMNQAGPENGNVIPEDRAMVAELMHFESFYLQGDYENSYHLGSEFLNHWGSSAGAYESRNMKVYVNTAKAFHTMNSYLTGRFEESAELADDIVSNPPAANERFRSLDVFMYGCVCGALSSEALGLSADAARFEAAGKGYNSQHYALLRSALLSRRAGYFAKVRDAETKTVAQIADTVTRPVH